MWASAEHIPFCEVLTLALLKVQAEPKNGAIQESLVSFHLEFSQKFNDNKNSPENKDFVSCFLFILKLSCRQLDNEIVFK